MAHQGLDRPSQHGLVPEQAVLLRDSAAEALAFPGSDDKGSHTHGAAL